MIGSLWDLKHAVMGDKTSDDLSIMIGSLWDLKHPESIEKLAKKALYHDRFPMGFETRGGCRHPYTQTTIMIGSLWDLKPIH